MPLKNNYLEKIYKEVENLILSLDDEVAKDIYALSFWKGNEDDDPRYPTITIGYNTTSHYQSQIKEASSEQEAKWNFAFWLQIELKVIGGVADKDLMKIFNQSGLYYSDEQQEASEDDDDLWDILLEKDEKMQEIFMDVIIQISQRLHSSKVIERKFGKAIPIIIHELEYYDLPLNWTMQGNPQELIAEFKKAMSQE